MTNLPLLAHPSIYPNRWPRRRIAAALIVTSCVWTAGSVGFGQAPVAPPAARPSATSATEFEVGPCPQNVTTVQADCGRLSVFENRATKRGRRIDIHFMVVRADQPGARTAVALFAGGPGQGSTLMAPIANNWMKPLRAQQDLLMVDQRGTGRSHPLNCEIHASTRPADAFGHVFDPALVAACRTALEKDADLTQYTTDIAIEDVDDIRARLGYEKLSLYGGSYGTRMAQAYLRRHPDRVSAIVLDGVVSFDESMPLTYARSAQQALGRAFAACAASPVCLQAHPDLAADLAAIERRMAAGPVKALVTPRGGAPVPVTMTAGDFGYAIRGILYRARGWAELPDLLGRAAATGDLSPFAQNYFDRDAGLRTIAHGQHFSVMCAEDVPYATAAQIDQSTAGTFIGRYLFDEYRNACAVWPRASIRRDARTPVTNRVPTLLVSGYFDPATPPEIADRVARSLPLSRTVVSPTSAHGSAAGCPRAAVLHVLAKGTFDGMPDVCK